MSFGQTAAVDVRFNVDTSGLNRAVAAVQRSGDQMKGKFKGIGKGAGLALVAGFTAGTVALGRLAANAFEKSVDSASNLNETISKTSVIFGQEAMPALEAWSAAAGKAFGQSQQQALDAASTFAVFGKSAGLSGDNLNGFSTKLTELSSDLSSFYNTSPEDAIIAIGAALRGESEPIRRYGVLLDDASLRQQALSMGITKTTKQALTPQQRVLAAQALIFKQTQDAQGDFARTSDGLANSQRTLQAELENTRAKVGTELLPVQLELTRAFLDALPAIKDKLVPAIKKLADKFKKDLMPGLVKLLPHLADLVGLVVDHIDKFIAFGGAIATISAAVKAATTIQLLYNLAMAANPIGLIITAVGLLIAGIVYLATQTTIFQDTFAAVGKFVQDIINKWSLALATFSEQWNNFFSGKGWKTNFQVDGTISTQMASAMGVQLPSNTNLANNPPSNYTNITLNAQHVTPEAAIEYAKRMAKMAAPTRSGA